jgi:hypothetical protein
VKETPKETVVVKEAPKEKSLSDKLTDLRNHVKNLGSVQEGSALVLNFFLDHSKEIEPVARPRVRELADAIASGTQGQPNVPAS